MKVQCPKCEKQQEDGGKRNACEKCGFQPIPSYAYPKASVFHPSLKAKGETINKMYKELKRRKAARARK